MSEKESNTMTLEEKLRDITECSICTETFREPKILSCIHTFCKICLQEMASKLEKRGGDEVPCPICRKKFLIPAEGFQGLQKNFFMERLIEMRNNLDPSSDRNVCEACFDGETSENKGEPAMAEVYCVDCQQRLCSECHKYHLKSKLFKVHKVLNLDELQENIKAKLEEVVPAFCDTHSMRPLEIYCFDCMDAVCALCVVESHKSHKISAVDLVVDEFKKQIQCNADGLAKCIPHLQLSETNLEEQKVEFTEHLTKLEVEIAESRDTLKALADSHVVSLLSELNVHREASLKNMELRKDDIQTLVISLDSFKTYCNQITTIGSANSICKAVESLNTRSVELKKLCDSHDENPFEFCNLHLSKRKKPTEKNILEELKGIHFGELKKNKSSFEKKDFNPEKYCKLTAFVQTNSAAAAAAATAAAAGDTTEAIVQMGSKIYEDQMQQDEEKERILKKMIEDLEQRMDLLDVTERNLNRKRKDLEQQLVLLRSVALVENAPTKSPGSINYSKVSKIDRDVNIFSETHVSIPTVMGLTILGNELFIAVRDQPKNLFFQIYALKTFRFKRRWKDKRLNEIGCIVSCGINKCVYLLNTLADFKNEIVRVDPQGVVIKCWSVNTSGQLSITPEANILFTPCYSYQLQEYSPDGNLVRTIPLSWNYGFENPWHAIKLNSSSYVVCHGSEGKSIRRICIIDSEGKVLDYVGKALGLLRPIYLEKDRDNNIILFDFGLKRLLVLNSNLKQLNSKIFEPENKMQIKKYCLDESNRRIFVVETNATDKMTVVILDTES